MKTLSANMQTHVAGEVLTLATCIMLERTDGTRLGFTDHPRDLTVDIGEGNEVFTSVGGFSSSAHGSDNSLSADNQDFLGVIDSSLISESDLKGGKYSGCKVWVFQVNYESIADGIIKIEYGEIADVTIRDQTWQAQAKSLASLTGQTVGDKYGRYCRATLGDARCGVELEPADWQASTVYVVGDAVKATSYDGRRYVCVTPGTSNDTEGEPTWDTVIGNTTTEADGVEWDTFNAWTKEGSVDIDSSDRQAFIDTGLTDADDYFRFGIVTWLTGNNAGLSEDVKSSSAAGTFVLKFPMPFDIEAGDTFTITAGCNHLLKMPADVWGTAYTGDCRAKFDNVVNFDAEPDIPGDDKIIKGPL